MSRHSVTSKCPTHQVVVGWDRPMHSFFAQVFDLESAKGSEDIVFWIGADRVGEVVDVEKLAIATSPYAEITEALKNTLREEKGTGSVNERPFYNIFTREKK